jgi:hypothetical protein
MDWEVKTKPIPENPSPEGKNESGVLVYLEKGSEPPVEVCRVLFVRRNAQNKSVGFKRQLLRELDKAYEAAEILNEKYIEPEIKDERKLAAVNAAEEKRQKFLEKIQESSTPRA